MMGLGSGWTGKTLADNLEARGVSRRSFIQMCGGLASVFALGVPVAGGKGFTAQAEEIADKLGAVTKPNVAWLQLQECTGCMESTLRSGGTTIEDMVLNLLSVNYNELVMAASGHGAETALEELNKEPHILVVNGSIPRSENGVYCMIGGKTAEQVLRDAAENATAILAVGACAVYGSVQAAKPNPTGAVGVDEIITDKPVINVSGCPPIGEVITATISYILTHGSAPKVDSEGRPLFAYDQRIHDSCPKRAHFDAGQFVRSFDDEAAKNGWCLYEVGCKGPSTYSPCPITQWNLHTSWPIGAGHPCIGCTEKDFFDKFTPFYEELPDIKGFGIESTAEKIGLSLVGAGVVGVAAHGAITAIKGSRQKRTHHSDTELLAALGATGSSADATAATAAADGSSSLAGRDLPISSLGSTSTAGAAGGSGHSCGCGGTGGCGGGSNAESAAKDADTTTSTNDGSEESK